MGSPCLRELYKLYRKMSYTHSMPPVLFTSDTSNLAVRGAGYPASRNMLPIIGTCMAHHKRNKSRSLSKTMPVGAPMVLLLATLRELLASSSLTNGKLLATRMLVEEGWSVVSPSRYPNRHPVLLRGAPSTSQCRSSVFSILLPS